MLGLKKSIESLDVAQRGKEDGRQTDKQTDRDRQTDRVRGAMSEEVYRIAGRDTEGQRGWETDRQTDRGRQTDRQSEKCQV